MNRIMELKNELENTRSFQRRQAILKELWRLQSSAEAKAAAQARPPSAAPGIRPQPPRDDKKAGQNVGATTPVVAVSEQRREEAHA